MTENQKIFESGKFFTGCNYWASHAGTKMWSDWRPDVIESDFKKLKEANILVMRMFPLWNDFQPLKMHHAGDCAPMEMRMREEPLPHTEAGQAGVDIVMADRFEQFCDLAEKYGIRLIVGLVTGWMSGRMHMPEAFEGRRLLTDPFVIRWQIRYVRYLVRRFKNHPAIAAWDLGNECNCMEYGVSHDQAFCWASQITNTVRVEDPNHPVVSGMHGVGPLATWTPSDLGEALDVLCTHPYPLFTPYCDTDPINQMKPILHATAESTIYADLSKKPCFIEEAGTLGPMISSEEVAGDYIRASLFSTWAHDLRGFIWWCANEQLGLEHTPYDWCAVERELGLFRMDGSKKPVLETMSAFTDFVDAFPYEKLPACLSDAVCILTKGQDTWAAGYGAYILAKQAGMDLHFAWFEDEIPESPVYMLPSLSTSQSLPRRVLFDLISRVERGAALYISINDAILSPFAQMTGVRVLTRSRRLKNDTVTLDGTDFSLGANFKYVMESVGADILLSADDGSPALTEYQIGKGRVIFLGYPIETVTAATPGVVSGPNAIPYYKFYEKMNLRNPERRAVSDSPYVCLTEHIVNENERLLVLINHTPEKRTAHITLTDFAYADAMAPFGGLCTKTADGFDVTLSADNGLVAVIRK